MIFPSPGRPAERGLSVSDWRSPIPKELGVDFWSTMRSAPSMNMTCQLRQSGRPTELSAFY
jgi:hypothetical protein